MKLHTPKFWQTPTFTAAALWPLSLVYRGVSGVNNSLRAAKSTHAGVPTISVGNITAGGTGKTPVVEAIARHFASQGQMVAILSRGYKGKQISAFPHQVTNYDTAQNVGDEPKMLFNNLRHKSVMVWVGKNRIASANRAVAAGATLLILDDAFQYRQLKRDMDLLVVDGSYKLGNTMCLPAGPMREPRRKISRADLVLVMNGDELNDIPVPQLTMTTAPKAADLSKLKGKKLVAFAGIGNPDKFFNSLPKLAAAVPFADHHNYTNQDLAKLNMLAEKHKATLVTTAKDAAKLPADFMMNVQVINLEFTTGLNSLLTRLNSLIAPEIKLLAAPAKTAA